MTEQEQRAVMSLVLMAAFADDRNEPEERQQVTRVAESLSHGGGVNVAAIYQDVLLKHTTLDDAAAALATPEVRRLAYELCVGVCDADGAQEEAERAFLTRLQSALEFDAAASVAAGSFSASADALAAAPLAAVSNVEPAAGDGTLGTDERERLVLSYAILNGALELLPDTLASMAIIPLQMRMVYRIGRSYGFELSQAHAKEFLATAGVGLASQYVEQIGVKLVGRMLGRGLGGALFRGVAGQSVSSGFSFATTYALGRLAIRYYGGGRNFSADVLQETYAGLLREARGLQDQYWPAIQEKARTVDVKQLLQEIRR